VPDADRSGEPLSSVTVSVELEEESGAGLVSEAVDGLGS
jgi:hypothetical protein